MRLGERGRRPSKPLILLAVTAEPVRPNMTQNPPEINASTPKPRSEFSDGKDSTELGRFGW